MTERDYAAAAEQAAADLGFHDPEDAARMIDVTRLKLDPGGQPVNMPEVVAELAERSPHLVDPRLAVNAGIRRTRRERREQGLARLFGRRSG